MGRGSFGDAVIRAVLAVALLGAAWFAAGDTLEMATLGKETTGTVVGYWRRDVRLPFLYKKKRILEPVVRLASGRNGTTCHTVYRDFRHERHLPSRGQSFPVRYRPDTYENCFASSTAFAWWKIGLGSLFGVLGALFGLSALSKQIVPW